MKTPILFFLITLFQTTLCYGQNLLSENKLWSNAVFGSENPDIYKSSYWIKFQGDTTINNVRYKKILQADDALHSDWYVNGYIREDTVAQKVYLFNNYTESDQLLYDFSLEKGDSILIWDGVTFVKIDTVLYEPFGDSKNTLKQICFNKGCTHKWIKGIGSSRGVLNGLNTIKTVGAYYYLLCYYKNENMVYSNPEFNDCFITTATRELPVSSDLIRAFQRTKGKLTVELNKAKSGKLYLYNTMGQLYKTEIITERLNTISLPGNGIFIYRFKSEDGKIQTGKIVN
jgi:hypothetical protein